MVHLIFVCKYRKKLLLTYGSQIKQILNDIAEEKDFGILAYLISLKFPDEANPTDLFRKTKYPESFA